MQLTLEIISSNGVQLGAARRKVFGPQGGRIGRSLDCDWVLSNPYVSRHQATVCLRNGTYCIESTGENRVAINSPQASIPPGDPRPLRSGDRLFIDDYEIAVTLDGAVFNDPPIARSAVPRNDSFQEDPTQNSRSLGGLEDISDEELDPLARLSGKAPKPTPEPDPKPSWNHTPSVNDQYTPPPVSDRTPPDAHYEAVIPEDWNKTVMGRNKLEARVEPSRPPPLEPSRQAAAPLPPRTESPQNAGPQREIPANWAETSFGAVRKPASSPDSGMPRPGGRPVLAGESRQSPSAEGVRPPEARSHNLPSAGPSVSPAAQREWPVAPKPPTNLGPVSPDQGVARPPIQSSPRSAAAKPVNLDAPEPISRTMVEPQARFAPARTPTPPESSQAGAFELEAFLRAAGLDPATLPADTAATLGQILRTIVQGVVEVLHARAQVKDQFRVATTRIMARENNPLKFAQSAESALSFLFGRPDPAYLGPTAAFEDAMNDIRFHQLAMLTGMREGFERMMNHFDPGQLQPLFDKRAKRGGLLALGAKSRYWEQYTEEFAELSADREAAFRRVFGEAFASGYEKQLNALKQSRGKPPQ